MKLRFASLFVLAISLPITASSAFAASIPVANFSFEMNNGFNAPCGGSCEYSVGLPIPSWNSTGVDTGQWITGGFAGNPPAFDGNVVAWSYVGTIWQDVGAAVAGETYTLQVEILHRTDTAMTGIAQLEVNGAVVSTATGVDMGPGTWSNWTATYTATPADAGKTVTILLSSTGEQGDWDDVRLDGTGTPTPEPDTIVLLGSGFMGLIGIARRRLLL